MTVRDMELNKHPDQAAGVAKRMSDKQKLRYNLILVLSSLSSDPRDIVTLAKYIEGPS